MATTTISATELSMNTGSAATQGAGTEIVEANPFRVLYPRHGKLIIWIDSDHADTKATFTAGDFIASGKGTLDHAVGNGTAEVIVVDSDRFKDDDGYVNWTWASNSAGYVRCFLLPDEA